MSGEGRDRTDDEQRQAREAELTAVLADCARDTADSERRVAERRPGTVRRVVHFAGIIALALAILKLLLRLAE